MSDIVGRLEPCPFCGGEARISERVSGTAQWFLVLCESCTCRIVGEYVYAGDAGSTAKARSLAIAAWNHRPEITRLRAEVERLTKERDEALGWARDWHGAVDATATILGLPAGMGVTEYCGAIQKFAADQSALSTLRDRVREVLRPFADFAPQMERFVEARAADNRTSIFPTKHFRLAHFDAARTLYQETTDE